MDVAVKCLSPSLLAGAGDGSAAASDVISELLKVRMHCMHGVHRMRKQVCIAVHC